MSIQDLQQDPQDTSNFYLANIYQATISPNSSSISTYPPLSPPPFSPPSHAVWVNALWFMSLVISLTCALLATLLQQWARRYLKITQPRYKPHKRARIRAFFAEGVEKRLLPWTVDALPTLLHISLFLFFAGLVVFLCNVNLTIFKSVLSWVSLCAALYGCITCMPIFCHDSPYYTPLSLPTWHVITGTLFFIYRFLRWLNWLVYRYHASRRFQDLARSCRKSLAQGMQKTTEETALNTSSEIDTRTFMWTFDCLDEDHELESFFSGLPGFRSSKVVNDPLPSLSEEEILKLYGALHGLLDRTFSSDLLPTPIKNRRALICAKAVDPEEDVLVDWSFGEVKPSTFCILDLILSTYQYSGPVATSIVKVLRGWGKNEDGDVQSTICKVLTSQLRDDSWYNIASDELGFPETSLRDYAIQGDSLSLVILIHVVRQQFTYFRKRPMSQKYEFSSVLCNGSKFNAEDTSSELQHEFCALWNQIVSRAQVGNDQDMASCILRPIRNVFLALHQDTDSAPSQFSASTLSLDHILWRPTSYPVCKVLDHIRVIGQTTTEDRRIPTISLSPVTTCVVHRNIGHSSTSGPPPKSNVSALPPAEITVGHTALGRAPSNNLNDRSSPSPMPVLDAIIPTGLLSFVSLRLDPTLHFLRQNLIRLSEQLPLRDKVARRLVWAWKRTPLTPLWKKMRPPHIYHPSYRHRHHLPT